MMSRSIKFDSFTDIIECYFRDICIFGVDNNREPNDISITCNKKIISQKLIEMCCNHSYDYDIVLDKDDLVRSLAINDTDDYNEDQSQSITRYIEDHISMYLDDQINAQLSIYNDVIEDAISYIKKRDPSIRSVTLYRRSSQSQSDVNVNRNIDSSLLMNKIFYRNIFTDISTILHYSYDEICSNNYTYIPYSCNIEKLYQTFDCIKRTVMSSIKYNTQYDRIHNLSHLDKIIPIINNNLQHDQPILIKVNYGILINTFYEVEYDDGFMKTYYVDQLYKSGDKDDKTVKMASIVYDLNDPISFADLFIRLDNSMKSSIKLTFRHMYENFSKNMDIRIIARESLELLEDATNDVSIDECNKIVDRYLSGSSYKLVDILMYVNEIIQFERGLLFITNSAADLLIMMNLFRHVFIPMKKEYYIHYGKDIFNVIISKISGKINTYLKNCDLLSEQSIPYMKHFDIDANVYIGYNKDQITSYMEDKLMDESYNEALNMILDLYQQLYVHDRENANDEYQNVMCVPLSYNNSYHKRNHLINIYQYLCRVKVTTRLTYIGNLDPKDELEVRSNSDVIRKINEVFDARDFALQFNEMIYDSTLSVFREVIGYNITKEMRINFYRGIIGNIRRFANRFSQIVRKEYPDLFDHKHQSFKELLSKMMYYLSFDSDVMFDVTHMSAIEKYNMIES